MASLRLDLPDEVIKQLEAGDMSYFKQGNSKGKGEGKGSKKDKPVDTAHHLAVVLAQRGFRLVMHRDYLENPFPIDDLTLIREFWFDPEKGKKGPRADFCNPKHMLAIECDGATRMVRVGKNGGMMVGGRHNSEKDRDRNNRLAILGYRKMTFSSEKIKNDPTGCVDAIFQAMEFSRLPE